MSFATQPKTTLAAVNDAQRKFHGQPTVTRDAEKYSQSAEAKAAYGKEAEQIGSLAATLAKRGNAPNAAGSKARMAATLGKKALGQDARAGNTGANKQEAERVGAKAKQAASEGAASVAGQYARTAARYGKKALGQDVRHPKAGNSQELQRGGQTVSQHDEKDSTPQQRAQRKLANSEKFPNAGEAHGERVLTRVMQKTGEPTGASGVNKAVKALGSRMQQAHTGKSVGKVSPKIHKHAAAIVKENLGDAGYISATDKSIHDVNEANEKFYGGNHKGMAQDASTQARDAEKPGSRWYHHSTVGEKRPHQLHEGAGTSGGQWKTIGPKGKNGSEVITHNSKQEALEHIHHSQA